MSVSESLQTGDLACRPLPAPPATSEEAAASSSEGAVGPAHVDPAHGACGVAGSPPLWSECAIFHHQVLLLVMQLPVHITLYF